MKAKQAGKSSFAHQKNAAHVFTWNNLHEEQP